MFVADYNLPNPTLTTVDDLEGKFFAAYEWLAGFDLNIVNTRFHEYRNNICEIACKIRQHEEFTVEHDKIFNTWKEISGLIHIHEGFNGTKVDGLDFRIKKLLKGHTLITKEKWKNSARQTAYELILASSLAKKNIVVDLSTEADIKFGVGGEVYFIECKYLLSKTKIKKNFKEALRQLTENYEKLSQGRSCHGVVALCIDFLYNPQFGVLGGDSQELRFQELIKGGNFFFLENKKIISRNRDERTIGVIASMTIPCYDKNNSNIGLAGLDTVYSYFNTDSRDYIRLRNLIKLIQDGYNTDGQGKLMTTGSPLSSTFSGTGS